MECTQNLNRIRTVCTYRLPNNYNRSIKKYQKEINNYFAPFKTFQIALNQFKKSTAN